MKTYKIIQKLKSRYLKIYKKNKLLFIFLLSFPHIYHVTFPYGNASIVNYFITRLNIATFIILLFLYLKRKKTSKLFIALSINDLLLLISTFLNYKENINKTILFVSSSLSLAMLIECYLDDLKTLTSGLLLNFELQLYPNLITVIFFRNTISSSCNYNGNSYFLGTKNDLILYLFPAIILVLIQYLLFNRKKRALALCVCILLTIILSGATTTLISFMCSMALFIYLYLIRKNKSKPQNIYFLIPLVLEIIVVVPYLFKSNNVVVDFIMNNVFYKHSFISRTAIWSSVKSYILDKPILGYGFNNKNIVLIDDIGRLYLGNAHNDLLQRLLNYGFLGLVSFVIFNVVLNIKLSRIQNNIIKAICVSVIFGLYFSFIAQDYHRFFELNIVFFLSYNVDKFNLEKIHTK